MLVSSKSLLQKAREGHYAIGHFNTSDLEITKGIIQAAEELKSPVIIGVSESSAEYAGLTEIAAIVRAEAEIVKIPVVLHADHFIHLEKIEEAIKCGFTSVMFDGSHMPYGKNVEMMQRVKQLVGRRQIQIEGELGMVGGTEDNMTTTVDQMTDPETAAQFVQITGIDSLAIAIGNAHGIPAKDERLDFDRLAAIASKVDIPLVLHGASSTPPLDIQKAIKLGVAKINIDTDLRLAFNESLRGFLHKNPLVYDPRQMMGATIETIKKVVESKIELFGSRDRG